MKVNFHVLRNVKISFEIKRNSSTSVNVNAATEQVFPCDENDISWQVCNGLRALLRSGKTECKIQLEFSHDERFSSKLKFKLDGPFTNSLIKSLGPKLFTEVSLGNLLIRRNGIYESFDQVNVKSLVKAQNCSCTGNGNIAIFKGVFDEFPFIAARFVVTISAELNVRIFGSVTCVPHGINSKDKSQDSVPFLKRILWEQFQVDTKITASNGTIIGCHKVFLSGNSSVFEKMLSNKSFVEGQTHSILLEDMSEMGLKSLLAFLYYADAGPAESDFDICLELLEASEKYGIVRLQQRMKSVLLDKPYAWFNLDGTLRLFCFTRNVENCVDLKTLAALVLKSKNVELEESASLKQLFKENPEAAMDLCCLISTF